MIRARTLIPATLLLACTGIAHAGGGSPVTISKPMPTLDRWMYPFNATPGYRPAASTFGLWTGVEGDFDNRDAQLVIGFDTSGDVDPGTANDYQVVYAQVTIQMSNEGIVFDGTTDSYEGFLEPENENYVEDQDAGQPIELFGTGYRGGFDATTWTEGNVFATENPTGAGTRSAYAATYRDGKFVDISNHVREGWTPEPFATGIVDGAAAGEVIPIDSVFEFEIDVTNPAMQTYILESIDQGVVSFTVASMTQVEFMGGTFPLFYCKENVAVEFGIASAATLEIVLEPADSGNPCDLTGDGIVDGADLSVLLGSWNTANVVADLDENGTVDGADLSILLGCWS